MQILEEKGSSNVNELLPGQCIVYEHAGYAGEQLLVKANVSDLSKKTSLNDKISSMRVGPSTTV